MLKAAVTKYCAEILATKKKTTAAAYAKSLGYFLLSTGKKNLSTINREDLMEFKVYLRDVEELASRRVYNRFENVMTFLKVYGITSATFASAKVIGQSSWR
jgi:hypothetical protein